MSPPRRQPTKAAPQRRGEALQGSEHLESIKFEFGRDYQRIGLRRETYPDLSYMVCKVVEIPEVPAHWATLIGDAVHNMRSGLDHLVWQLAILNLGGRRLPKRTEFPVCDSPSAWLDRITKDKVRDLSPWHRAMIKARQPYQGLDPVREVGPFSALGFLNGLSRLDKHRAPPLVRAAIDPLSTNVQVGGGYGVDSVQPSWYIGPALEVGAELIRLELTNATPDVSVEVEYQFTTKIHFNDGNGPRVDHALQSILVCVTRVTGDFVGEFRADGH